MAYVIVKLNSEEDKEGTMKPVGFLKDICYLWIKIFTKQHQAQYQNYGKKVKKSEVEGFENSSYR